MEVLGQVEHRLHGDPGVGVGAPLADLFGGDRAAGLLDPGEAAGAEDGGVLEVDVQHHLTLAARLRLAVVVVRGRGSAGCGPGCRPPSRGVRRGSRSSRAAAAACASAATAASRSRASARSTSPSTRTRPSTPTLSSSMSKWPASAAASLCGFGLLGVEPGDGLVDQPGQLRRADLVGHRGDVQVHERRRLRGQAHGAVRDLAELPRRQLPGQQPGPAAPQPVPALDDLGQVAAPGLGRATHRSGELGDRELRDLRAPLATQRQRPLVPLIDRPHQGLGRVHRDPRGGGLE